MIYILMIIIFFLISLLAFLYIKTKSILERIEKIIDSAIENNFEQENFSEHHLSKIEDKLFRYLAKREKTVEDLSDEKTSIQHLVSDLSHQTKTPISNILLYIELLKEKIDDIKLLDLIESIKGQADKLNFLVLALVKISRLENDIITLSPKKNRVNTLFEDTNYTLMAKEKGIKFFIDNLDELYAKFDLKWTREAVFNIVDNAIKYTDFGGEIKVRFICYEFFVRIDIEDNGMGIEESEISKIFTRFYRCMNAADKDGVGIGLYLSRKIISMQGGYIKVKSEVGKGSLFSIFIPIN